MSVPTTENAVPLAAETVVNIHCDADILAARQAGRKLAVAMGFGLADQTRLATAISELTRNVKLYAGSGQCRISDQSDSRRQRIVVVVEDWGPGIRDLEKALTQGYSTSGGLGTGLPGTRRLMSEFHLHSVPGQGTRVTIALSRARG